jgi:hypothetical protein
VGDGVPASRYGRAVSRGALAAGRWRLRPILLAAVAVAVVVAVAAAGVRVLGTGQSPPSPTWVGDFDVGQVPPWTGDTGRCGDGRQDRDNQYRSVEAQGNPRGRCPTVQLVSDLTRTGDGRAMRIEMPPGSQRATPSSTYRWDVPGEADGELDMYVGMSVYFRRGFPTDTWMSPVSFRVDSDDSGSLVVQLKDDHLVFRRSVNASWDGCEAGSDCSNDDLDMGPVVEGRWIDFVFRVRWSSSPGTAVREVWRDGELMGSSRRPNVLGGSEYRLRVGMYQDRSTRVSRILYYDEVRIGRSYDAVNPAGADD